MLVSNEKIKIYDEGNYNETSPLVITKGSTINTFERVRSQPSALWKKIKKSPCFKVAFQSAVGTGTTTAFFAFVLPSSLVVGGITLVGLAALGLLSPALLNSKSSKAWRKAKNKLVGLLTDLIILPKIALTTPLAFQPNSSFNVKEKSDVLVVGIHGFLHNKTCWGNLLKRLLQQTKHTEYPISKKDFYAINLGEPVTVSPIETYARFLATKLEQIRKTRNLEKLKVILVCHSMGGLVAGLFATQFAQEIQVKVLRLIANGTPWHGTPLAKMGTWSKCGKEMVPGHSLQVTLKDQIGPLGNRIFTIASKGDTVVPFDSAKGVDLPIPNENRIVLKCPLGHLAMLHSPQTKAENIRLIREVWEKVKITNH